MSPNRADRLLGEWSAVASTAKPPASPERALRGRAGGLGFSLIGVGLLALALVVGLAWLSGRDERPNVGDTSPPSSSAAPTPAPSPSAPASPASPPVPSSTPEVSPTPSPTLNPCIHLAAPLEWEGAAGQRIAHVTLVNRNDGDCLIGEFERVQYVDGANRPLIEGPAAPGFLTIPANSSVSTLVEVGNYCGPEPQQPVGIIFVYKTGGILLVGSPEDQADLSVPPCNGQNAPATIQMQPWAPSGG
ncbi:MAG TPA: hypothetical protein VFV72_06000 [Candidatus Limnocylindrales bacterium]|nr:hypothetical protein [Candidatus Limnocylindrales bacterium]